MLIQFTGSELLAFGRKLPATCVVRNELNGWRKRDQVVLTAGQTTPHGLAYQPRMFPPGEWEVTRVVDMSQDTEFWPVFIDTDANQMLRIWNIEDGKYYGPAMKWVTGWGYGIHHARYSKLGEYVPSNTTLGCINVLSPDDASWLGMEVRNAKDMKCRVDIKVPPWNEWKS